MTELLHALPLLLGSSFRVTNGAEGSLSGPWVFPTRGVEPARGVELLSSSSQGLAPLSSWLYPPSIGSNSSLVLWCSPAS